MSQDNKSAIKVKKKRRCLSISEKIDVIHELLRGEKNKAVCQKYNLKSSTVSTLWKNRGNIIAALTDTHTSTKKLRKCELADLDQALYDWFTTQSTAGVPINGPTLKLHAEKIAKCLGHDNFTCNNGWLGRFKFRHNIAYASVRGVTVERAERADQVDALRTLRFSDAFDLSRKNEDDEDEDDEEDDDEEDAEEDEWMPLDLSPTGRYYQKYSGNA